MSETMYTFPNGLPGFEDCTQFELCHEKKGDVDMFQLQSVDQKELAFNLIDPAAFDLNYQFTLSDEEQELLEAKSAEDILVFLMLSRKESGEASAIHANVAGPLVLNVSSRKGMQKVLNKVDYSVNLAEK
ncbi:flagellar assembly protein FliW [Thermodesulfobacteriota bacterium]